MSGVGWERVYVFPPPGTHVHWVFWYRCGWVAGKLDRSVKAPVLSFGENLFFIHFCSLEPSSSFCKDWVFPKCFNRLAEQWHRQPKLNRLPNCSRDLLFSSPLPWGALEAGMCRPGIIPIDKNRLPWMESKHTKGATYPAIWVCTPRCVFTPKVEIGYFWLYKAELRQKLHVNKFVSLSHCLSSFPNWIAVYWFLELD